MKILDMLTYKRPAGSASELEFLERYVMPLRPSLMSGNLVITVPGDPDTLFSCHTDTVHKESGMQIVIYDEPLAMAFKEDKEALGADDTAGVFMLLSMIEAQIPGTYVFHYGEERGCIGSKKMAREHASWLKTFKRAIAFDRRGTTSIITHQMHDRCCSDEFGQALADELGCGYKLDNTGLYTDTASYMELIPECTNVSVGYDHEHGPEEFLDIEHLNRLVELVKDVRWAQLPTSRDPAEKPAYTYPAWWEPQELEFLIDDAYDEIKTLVDAEDLVRWEPERAAALIWAFINEPAGVAKEPLHPLLYDEEELIANYS